MLVIELNEFNAEMLRRVAEVNGFKNIINLLSLRHIKTTCRDNEASGYLEPWSQWVSVHTGMSSKSHKIKNLGDVPKLGNKKQIWEIWSDKGLSSIIWGVMNGSRCNSKLVKVFLPDPWSFTENAFPARLGGLLKLPRYLAKNYLCLSFSKILMNFFGFGVTVIRNLSLRQFFDGLSILYRAVALFGLKNISFICAFEYISASIFLNQVNRQKPDRAVLFINMLAHCQHHYWFEKNGENCRQIVFAVSLVDRILGGVFKHLEGNNLADRIVVMNALSQRWSLEEDPWILYRPNNHEELVQTLGLNALAVESLMTYDAHVLFASEKDRDSACGILKATYVDDHPLFFVERDNSDVKKLFYRVAFAGRLASTAVIESPNYSGKFFGLFTAIVQRTGAHVSEGDAFLPKSFNLPPVIENWKLLWALESQL